MIIKSKRNKKHVKNVSEVDKIFGSSPTDLIEPTNCLRNVRDVIQ